MKSRIVNNWNGLRWIRLLIGVAALVQGIIQREWMVLFAGTFIAGTALLNYGCCGADGCALPAKKKNESSKEITYEEVGP